MASYGHILALLPPSLNSA